MTGTLETIRGLLQGGSVRWVLRDSSDIKVLFNVTQSFSRAWPGNIPDRPIEDGTTITDHVSLGPQRIEFSVLLTPDSTGITLAAILKTDVDTRAEQLIAWRNATEILTLTGRQEITSVVIENLIERKSSDLKDSRMFDVVLRKIKIADTDVVSESGLGTVETQTEETPQ